MAATFKVYSYKKCSTCVKAIKFLKEQGVDYKEIDIYTDGPSKSELKKMLREYEGDIKKLFNTSGLVYRSMKLSGKVKNMTEVEALDLLASDGRLVKRPFIVVDKGQRYGQVGFKEEEWLALIK